MSVSPLLVSGSVIHNLLASQVCAGPGSAMPGILESAHQNKMKPFQDHALLSHMTARQNVRIGVDSVYPHLSRAERRDIAQYFLNLVGLEGAEKTRVTDMSAGMRQRVGVARAFALSPRMLLLDEPFGALDFITRYGLQKTLMNLCQESGKAALMVTHDVDEAILLADRIIMMTNGPEAVIGEVAAVDFERPRDRRALLQDARYYVLREHLIDFLENRANRLRAAA